MSEMIVYDSLLHGSPARERSSAIGKWLSSISGGRSTSLSRMLPRSEHVETGMAVARQGGESLITGLALGALHATLPGGLDIKKVPIDATVGALAMLAAVAAPDKEYTKDLQNIGAAGVTVYGFRAAQKFVGEKRLAKAGSVTPSVSGDKEDPVIAAARRL